MELVANFQDSLQKLNEIGTALAFGREEKLAELEMNEQIKLTEQNSILESKLETYKKMPPNLKSLIDATIHSEPDLGDIAIANRLIKENDNDPIQALIFGPSSNKYWNKQVELILKDKILNEEKDKYLTTKKSFAGIVIIIEKIKENLGKLNESHSLKLAYTDSSTDSKSATIEDIYKLERIINIANKINAFLTNLKESQPDSFLQDSIINKEQLNKATGLLQREVSSGNEEITKLPKKLFINSPIIPYLLLFYNSINPDQEKRLYILEKWNQVISFEKINNLPTESKEILIKLKPESPIQSIVEFFTDIVLNVKKSVDTQLETFIKKNPEGTSLLMGNNEEIKTIAEKFLNDSSDIEQNKNRDF